MPGVNIFISYRRDDAAGHAGRLCDRLDDHFPSCVFMDVTGIAPGADFVQALEHKLASCHVLIVVIGKSWLALMNEREGRDEPDYVRIEVAAALRKGVHVIPVLVQGARMPKAGQLPPDLKPLANRHALEITEPDFRGDVRRLVEAIEQKFRLPRPEPVPPPPPPRRFPLWLKMTLGLGTATVLGGLVIISVLLIIAAQSNNSFSPAGGWVVTGRDSAQSTYFGLTLGPAENRPARVEYTGTFHVGNWEYDAGQQRLVVRDPNYQTLLTLDVREWHQDHFHALLTMPDNSSTDVAEVNMRRR